MISFRRLKIRVSHFETLITFAYMKKRAGQPECAAERHIQSRPCASIMSLTVATGRA